MSKRTAPNDSKASGFKTLKAFFTSGPKKSPPSSTATTPEPDNPESSTPETPIPGPSRLLEPLAPLATLLSLLLLLCRPGRDKESKKHDAVRVLDCPDVYEAPGGGD